MKSLMESSSKIFDVEDLLFEQDQIGVIEDNKCEYNFNRKIDAMCFKTSLNEFLRTGTKEDAFEVYFCYAEIFKTFGGYGNGIDKLLNLLYDHESKAATLLMKHRDIDFHIYTDALNPVESFKAITKICADPHVSQLEYRNLAATEEACLEWHIRYDLDGESWQIDMIQILKGSQFDGYFERVAARIKAVLTPETRRTILELKYLPPGNEHIPGIEYYQAVIADGVRTWPEFSEWRRANPANGINLWCP